MEHPGDGLLLTLEEVHNGKELSQKINIEGFVERDNIADPKLLTQSQSLSKIGRIGPHVRQTDRLHIWNKGVLPVLHHQLVHISLLLVPELGALQRWILRLVV